MLEDAQAGKRKIWYSTLLYAEMRRDFLSSSPNCPFKTIEELIASIEGVMLPITPIPAIMKRAGRMRSFVFRHHEAQKNEKNRVLTVADSVQLATCLFVKETFDVRDIEFHTFDDGKGRNYDVTLDDKVVSLIRFEDYARAHLSDVDIQAVCSLKRIKPQLAQAQMDLTATATLPQAGGSEASPSS